MQNMSHMMTTNEQSSAQHQHNRRPGQQSQASKQNQGDWPNNAKQASRFKVTGPTMPSKQAESR
jgi:hypothetical protein